MGSFGLIWQGQFGLNYLKNPVFSTSYYILGALLGIFLLGRDSFSNIISNKKHCGLILIQLVLFLVLPSVINMKFPIDTHVLPLVIEKKFFFPLFDIRVSVSKLAEIIFQQSLILVMIHFLRQKLPSRNDIVRVFTIIFFLMHTPLVILFELKTALIFILPSLLAGFLFSYSIVKFKYGVALSYGVHLGFYLVVGLLYRTDLINLLNS